jgi:hypothetical protein
MYKKSSNYNSESCKSEAAGKAAGKVYMFIHNRCFLLWLLGF